MATATSLIAGGSRNAFDTIGQSTNNSLLIQAKAGVRIRVLALAISCGATASTVQFKSASGGTAISPVFQNSISMPTVDDGWFQTVAGEGLYVDTGAGSNTGLIVVWAYAKA